MQNDIKKEDRDNILVVCYQCHRFSYKHERELITCECSAEFIAIRLRTLTDGPWGQHVCIGITATVVAQHDGFSLYKTIPPRTCSDGGCMIHGCCWGAPYVLTSAQEETKYFDKKPSRTNIYPVTSTSRNMFHATRTRNIFRIRKWGLQSKEDFGVRVGHGFQGAERWLRYTGSYRAAKAHLPSDRGTPGIILPIAFEGKILETCMHLHPDRLIRLFEVIPQGVACIQMNEDGESYVFRRQVHLAIDKNRLSTARLILGALRSIAASSFEACGHRNVDLVRFRKIR